jgi:alpha-glucosidase (family GH31 glycosyl hydrolase)
MRDHSWHGKHHPWANGENGLRNFQYYYAERMRLLDHIYSTALSCRKNGGTVVQSMAIAYGASPSLDTQYIFCNDFLVRPVLEYGQRQAETVIPTDGFYDYYTGVRYNAGTHIVDAPADRIPLFVKAGAVIAYRQYRKGVIPTFEKDEYDEAVLITPTDTLRKSTVHTDAGEQTFASTKEEGMYHVTADTPCARKTVIILGAKATNVSADAAVLDVVYDEQTNRTTVTLEAEWQQFSYMV